MVYSNNDHHFLAAHDGFTWESETPIFGDITHWRHLDIPQ